MPGGPRVPVARLVHPVRRRPARQRRSGVAAAPLGAITFPASPLTARVEIALGADPAADPATWAWLDITGWVRYNPGIQITQGRRDESNRVEASVCRLTLDNADGRWVRRNPTGPYYGLLSKNTPIRIGVDPGDGVHYRYHGFVNAWPTRWTDESGTDSTVPIECGGILRRMQQGDPIDSALFRSMSGISEGDFRPVAYWPMEDGSDATEFAAATANTLPAVPLGAVTPAGYSGIPGSQPLPTMGGVSTIDGTFPEYEPTGVWQLQFPWMLPERPTTNTTFFRFNVTPGTGGSIALLHIYYDYAFDLVWVQGLNSAGAVVDDMNISPPTYGEAFMMAITCFASGGDLLYVLSQFRDNGNMYLQTNMFDTPGALASTLKTWRAQSSGISQNWAFGHLAAYTDPAIITSANIGPNSAGMGGHAGEMAHERLIRVFREEGVPLRCTSAVSALMGPQPTASLLQIARECEAADMGVLYEHEFGLGYQSLDERLNAPALLELDFDSRHVANTPEPADDDQRLVNRYRATRSGGTSTTVQDDASIAAAGVFQGSGTFSLSEDRQAADVAGWKVHQGTVDEDRWPAIPICLHRTPDLIGPWTSLPYGSRTTLANPPDELAPDTIDAVTEGWSETIRPHGWDAVLNTTPASVYATGQWAADDADPNPLVGRWQSDTLQLTGAVDASTLTWSVDSEPAFTETPAHFPQLVKLGGEVVRVASVSGNTWTLSHRAVNGVSKSHDPANPAERDITLLDGLIWVP